MKHVALLKTDLNGKGGLEKNALHIAKGFLDRGNKVSLLTAGSLQQPLDPAISIHQTTLVRWPRTRRLEQYDHFVHQWIEKNQPDLIFGMDRNRFQTHLRAGNGVHAAYLKTKGWMKQLIASLHPFHAKILELERTAFQHPKLQKIFTNSHMVRRDILNHYCVEETKIEVIHNGVEWHQMQEAFDQWPKQKPEEEAVKFLFVGNGYERKGLKQLLHALSHLPHHSFHLTVIGHDRSIEWYRSLAARLNLSDRVTFLGPRKDLWHFYQLSDVLVIPSLYDPFANVTLEALAMGLFVLSSTTNGGSEILNQSNGAIIPNLFDRESFVHALKCALHQKKTRESAQRIRASVQAFDFSHQLRTLIDLC